ncbi:YbaB/EbfC family nucleoid-associated protein [Denitrobaculum tricleocarpae]|uniref:Nucleoid-associated protein FKG95_01275 n=1 Tax=Denitrobaculum tricleocarpae TaxID=2591009 RepID=A0A545U1B0_9PROT|nr:YbaB/EbfC family nucleoid-associated protein [Denitrobaculum tricleocarpae]TQV83260.1 YbaB/EbfC family nucleoid-associated protein [Denitrobaculum tricleocarpae]
MKNLAQMMKQAQQMQSKMTEMQEKLVELEVTGVAGGGMVRVTLNGKSEMRSVKIDPALIDPNDPEVLEDLIVAASNDAKQKVEAEVAEKMKDMTGGLNLPEGFKLPF